MTHSDSELSVTTPASELSTKDPILSHEHVKYVMKLSYTLEEIRILCSRLKASELISKKDRDEIMWKLNMFAEPEPLWHSSKSKAKLVINVGNAMAQESRVRMTDLSKYNVTPLVENEVVSKIKATLKEDAERLGKELGQPRSFDTARLKAGNFEEQDWELLQRMGNSVIKPLFGGILLVRTFNSLLRRGPDSTDKVIMHKSNDPSIADSCSDAHPLSRPQEEYIEMPLKDRLQVDLDAFYAGLKDFPLVLTDLIEKSQLFPSAQTIIFQILVDYPPELMLAMFIRFWYYPNYTVEERIIFALHGGGNLSLLANIIVY